MSKKVNRYPFSTRDEFLAIREKLHQENRLGGSDIGTAAGVNKHKSARRLYEEFVGNIAAPDLSDKQSIKDGIICEDIVAQKFMERTGMLVHRVNAVMTNDDFPHLFASIDRKIENMEAGLECKTANAMNHDAFKDGKLPQSYVRQVISYMAVTGYRLWYVHVWVMGVAEYTYAFVDDIKNAPAWADGIFVVGDADFLANERVAAQFFESVNNKIPTPTTGHDDEVELLRELFPEATDDEPIALTQVDENDINRIHTLEECINDYEREIAEIKDAIKSEMGEHAFATVGETKISWRNNKTSSKTDWKSVAKEAGANDDIIEKYTKVSAGARVLRIS